MTLPLASRIALVTGASRGIGYATARALARAGAHIVAVARTQGGLEELDDEIRKDGGNATLVPLSLTDFEGIARTDRAVEFTGLVVYRICDGKIVESWGEIDFVRLIRQLRRP